MSVIDDAADWFEDRFEDLADEDLVPEGYYERVREFIAGLPRPKFVDDLLDDPEPLV